MRQEIKDFLDKTEVKLVDPYLVEDSKGAKCLCIAAGTCVDLILCVRKNSTVAWETKASFKNTQPISRSIEDGLVAGDIITNFYGDRKILMANQYCVVLSQSSFDRAGDVYTYTELIDDNYKLKE